MDCSFNSGGGERLARFALAEMEYTSFSIEYVGPSKLKLLGFGRRARKEEADIYAPFLSYLRTSLSSQTKKIAIYIKPNRPQFRLLHSYFLLSPLLA